MNQVVHEISGRKFYPIKITTIEHDFWLIKQVREGKLDNLKQEAGEPDPIFAVRAYEDVLSSGKAFLLLGALLIESGKRDEDWTPAMAEANAEFFRSLTAPADKAKMPHLIVTTFFPFFRAGLRSSKPSRISLNVEPQGQPAAQN